MFVFIFLQSCPFQCESDIVVVFFFYLTGLSWLFGLTETICPLK